MFVSAKIHARALDDLTLARDTLTAERDRFELHAETVSQDLAKTRADLAAEAGKREILSRQVAVQDTMIEFLCSRVNQLEAERALMLRHLTNVDIPVPSLRPRPVPADALDMTAALGSSIFEDDPAHAPAGWHADGTVNYGSNAAKQ